MGVLGALGALGALGENADGRVAGREVQAQGIFETAGGGEFSRCFEFKNQNFPKKISPKK